MNPYGAIERRRFNVAARERDVEIDRDVAVQIIAVTTQPVLRRRLGQIGKFKPFCLGGFRRGGVRSMLAIV